MSKKLPYDLTKEEIEDLLKKKKEIANFVMKKFKKENPLSVGKPHLFKITLDDGWASYEYDLTLNENWSMFEIQKRIGRLFKRYNGTISEGKLLGSGYQESGSSVDTDDHLVNCNTNDDHLLNDEDYTFNDK